jgi:hypothetical protein
MQTYYAVVAQVIPVFLLIFVVGDSRMRARSPEFDPGFVGAAVSQVALLLIGELCALRILATGSETPLLRNLVAMSISLALGNVVMRYVHSLLSDVDPAAVSENRPPSRFWLVAVLGLTTMAGSFAILTFGT